MDADEFEAFVKETDPQLRRALSAHLHRDEVADAIAEAFVYAWRNWDRVRGMDNRVGYLYRVAQSKSRDRREGFVPWPDDGRIPDVEPALVPALRMLPASQLRSVWLVHGCGWSHREVGEALGMKPSTVSTHVARALVALRAALKVGDHDRA